MTKYLIARLKGKFLKISNLDLIKFEFELESEIRYIIEPCKIDDYEWENHVEDVYDESGRVRIRVKNGKPRMSLKVPLFTKDTHESKTCIRLEFKPVNLKQEQILLQVRKLILAEENPQVSEKWGAKVSSAEGSDTWINRDATGNWWIEIDSNQELNIPKDIIIRSCSKSSVKAL